MAAPEAGSPDQLSRARELAHEPDAVRWARVCAWIPGTGHCCNRDCTAACPFQAQRAADARNVARWRRVRRIMTRLRLR